MLKLILIFLLIMPYIIFFIMYKKVSLGEWSGFFLVTLLWYLLLITALEELNILSTFANIGAFLGIILSGVFALIGAIKKRKISNK